MNQELIDSRQLQCFYTLLNTRSFTDTAKLLFVSQSAISHAIKKLEADLNCTLLRRVGKSIQPTQAGEELYEVAKKVLSTMRDARESIGRQHRWTQGRIRIGASTTACQYILPNVIREFRECFPNCQITILPNDTPGAIEDLESGKTDMAFVLNPEKRDDLTFIPMFEDEMKMIVSPAHDWARRGAVELSRIESERFILYNKSSYTYMLIERFFSQQGIRLRNSIELGSNEAIKEMIKIGLGVGILADWNVQTEIDKSHLIALNLGRRKLKRNWGIVTLKGRKMELVEETFVGLCESFTAD